MHTLKRISLPVALLLLPSLAYAQGTFANLLSLVNGLAAIMRVLIPIAFAAAVVFFFWGLALYILSAGNEEKKAEGRRIMIGGVIALFIMASIWGIVIFMRNALGVGPETTTPTPTRGSRSMLSIAPLLNNINKYLLNPFIILLFTLALLVFFWGLFKFIGRMDSPEEREKGKKNILYGLLGMLIMISVYAIISVILNTFDVSPPRYLR